MVLATSCSRYAAIGLSAAIIGRVTSRRSSRLISGMRRSPQAGIRWRRIMPLGYMQKRIKFCETAGYRMGNRTNAADPWGGCCGVESRSKPSLCYSRTLGGIYGGIKYLKVNYILFIQLDMCNLCVRPPAPLNWPFRPFNDTKVRTHRQCLFPIFLPSAFFLAQSFKKSHAHQQQHQSER